MGALIEYGKGMTVEPKHLDACFFTEVLETAVRSAQLEIITIGVSMGSTTGDNYCSQIYRVRIEYRLLDKPNAGRQTLMVIVKSIPQSDSIEFLQDLQMYLKEKITYTEVLPRMEVLTQGHRKFGPKLYHSLKVPENTLVFEDLGQSGFIMANRETGLDEAHCRLVMRRLAEFHAASMALAQKDPGIFDTFDGGMLARRGIERTDGLLMRFFSGNAQQLYKVVSGWAGYEDIAAKIKKYIDNLLENLVRSTAPLKDEVKVLNHGDLWVNNMLFKYDQQNEEQQSAQDVIFIDFQLSVWGSPGLDLNYFFYTSMSLDVLKHKRLDLIREYHNRLSASLRSMGLNEAVPSYEDILTEVRRREAFGFFANYGILPTITQDKNESSDSNLDNLVDEEFAKQKIEKIFASKRLLETLQYTLHYFDEAGVFS